jgi:hypothetical protein
MRDFTIAQIQVVWMTHFASTTQIRELIIESYFKWSLTFISYIALNCVHIYNGWRICNKKPRTKNIPSVNNT